MKNFGTKGCMYCEGECNKECLPKPLVKEVEIKFNVFQKENPIVPNKDIRPFKLGFIECAKWQQERMYSEEDMRESFMKGAFSDLFNTWNISKEDMAKEKFELWFEQFKKK